MTAKRVLHASCLASKWGFDDGALLLSQIVGYGDELPSMDLHGADYQDVLVWLVRKHLLPKLPGVEVYEIATSHNPIRTDQPLTREQREISVEITQSDVDEAVASLSATA